MLNLSLFARNLQRNEERNYVLSAGKTTLLKSKAASLARAGESVTFIFMGGNGKTEAVMSIANKLDFAKYHQNITILSQQDLEEQYRQVHPRQKVPSPLSLVKFHIEMEKPQHLMVDEVPLERSTRRQLLTLLTCISSKLESYFGLMGVILYFAVWLLLCLLPLLLYGDNWWAAVLRTGSMEHLSKSPTMISKISSNLGKTGLKKML